MVTIPLVNITNLAFFSVQALLDGVTYTLSIRWNVRASGWFMDVLNEAGDTVLVAGIRLVGGAALSFERTGRPYPGCFGMYDTSNSGLDADFSNLGSVVLLQYFEASDFAAAKAGTL